jgi:hypothetical protein
MIHVASGDMHTWIGRQGQLGEAGDVVILVA